MTTNRSESLNGVLRGVRALPITAFVMAIFHRVVEFFLKHRGEGAAMSTQFVSNVENTINSRMRSARAYTVRRFRAHERCTYWKG